ncbi:ABC transporter ATP-binding protein [Ottowia beijingensis]|uniref:ABC transporter ATP-binding protein n=1 Tax=Ottowia beijingensis TaxID=1207057 RepID=A0A853IYU1_9BURK|nr:ABC transporter ATP-binding protein [Ottowia beijingensis]
MSKPLLELENFSVCYGPVEAVHQVALTVGEGEIVTVIGPNGAGKSTLLNAIMGLLGSSGTLRLGGQPMARPSVEAMVDAGVGLVPEKRELFGEMSVEDNLLLGGFARWRRGQRDQKERMAEVFKLFPRMQERRAQMASTLSGGERQMLAIGRALMARPRLLMLDEPSLGLAPLIVREVLNIVASLRDMGVSVLLVEQNARAALNVADRGYVLEMGEVALTGAAGELMHDRRVIETYLGVGGNKAPLRRLRRLPLRGTTLLPGGPRARRPVVACSAAIAEACCAAFRVSIKIAGCACPEWFSDGFHIEIKVQGAQAVIKLMNIRLRYIRTICRFSGIHGDFP